MDFKREELKFNGSAADLLIVKVSSDKKTSMYLKMQGTAVIKTVGFVNKLLMIIKLLIYGEVDSVMIWEPELKTEDVKKQFDGYTAFLDVTENIIKLADKK